MENYGNKSSLKVPVGIELLGRIVNYKGIPIDGLEPITTKESYPLQKESPNPLTRKSISEKLITGLRSIDGLLTIGKGQKMGVFSGSGIGKTKLLTSIANYSNADINVFCLIGIRKREIFDFYNVLSDNTRSKTVIIASAGDEPAFNQIQTAYAGTTVAEYFRDQGKDVAFFFDSMSRFANAQFVNSGIEMSATLQHCYPVDISEIISKLMERTGTNEKGTITAFYTVLAEDDRKEPIADIVRSAADGHIVLSRKLALRHQFPPVDLSKSINYVSGSVTDKSIQESCKKIRNWIILYEEYKNFIITGQYRDGVCVDIDEAIENHRAIISFCAQGYFYSSWEDTIKELLEISKIPFSEK